MARKTPVRPLAIATALLAISLALLALASHVLAPAETAPELVDPDPIAAVDGGSPVKNDASRIELDAADEHEPRAISPRAPVDNPPAEAVAKIDPEHGIRGLLRGPSGAPIAGTVAVFARRGSSLVDGLLAQADTDASGAFAIDPGRSGELLLVACAGSCEPAEREIALERGRDLVLDAPIVLAEGGVISGRVRAGTESLSRVELVAILDRAGDRYELASGPIVRVGGRFARSFATAETDAEGRYTIRGLSPDVHRVHVSSMRGPQVVLGLTDCPERTIRAPAERVDFEVGLATLRIRLLDGEERVEGCEVQLRSPSARRTLTSDAAGEACFRVVPGLEAELLARHLGRYRLVRRTVFAPRAGEERVELVQMEPARPPADLVLEVVAGDGGEIDELEVSFLKPGAGTGPVFKRAVSQGDDPAGGKRVPARLAADPSQVPPNPRAGDPRSARLASTSRGASRFFFEAIPAGAWRLSVRTTVLRFGGKAENPYRFCELETEIEVPDHGLVEQRIVALPRPWFEATARDVTGRRLEAACTGYDGAGHPYPAGLFVQDGEGGFEKRNGLDRERPTRVYPDVCSGRCLLEFSLPGFRARRIEADLLPGKPPPLDVVLERE
jgi:hypothetical protein